MRLAWFTPLPPMASGIADYSFEIVPFVAQRAEVDVFCPSRSGVVPVKSPRGAKLRDPDDFARDGYDACLYHLGNNPFHDFVYRSAKDRPAITVFHDAVLHHLISFLAFEEGRKDFRSYEEILVEELGEMGRELTLFRRLGFHTEFEKFMFPLTGHVARRSKGIVVHSRDALDRLQEVAPGIPMTLIPHHAGEPPREVAGVTREEARERLGLPRDAFIVGHLGFITKPKQPSAVVGGFARLNAEVSESLLLMVGADRTGGALQKLIIGLGIEKAVRMAGFVDLPQFYLYLKAIDVMINLRYPSAGESSGTFARALAEGRAVIVNNYGSFAEVPGDVALKVEIDRPQAEQIGEHLLHLARNREFQRRLEGGAREYARTVLDPVRCRDMYVDFAEQVGWGDDLAIPEVLKPQPLPRVTLSETVRAMHRLRRQLDAVDHGTLSQSGNAAYIDLLYRLLLRRPAEDEAVRAAHRDLVGGSLTRAELADQILGSREFAELRVTEEVLKQAAASGGAFSPEGPLGPNTTERVVEVPWMLSRWQGERRVLDAGYAFASGVYFSALLDLRIPSVHGVDRAVAAVPGMTRVQADLRGLPYRDGSFELVFCISTIEHVGRENRRYGLPEEPTDERGDARALTELARILVPGGRLLVSVPFGRAEDHDWLRQYDEEGWRSLVAGSGLSVAEEETYRLTPEGWVKETDPAAMRELSYGDDAPAARGVLCATLVKG